MQDLDQAKFLEEVADTAENLVVEYSLLGAKWALPTPASAAEKHKQELVVEAVSQAEQIVEKPEIRVRICSALKGISDDVREVASVVTAALLPLSLAGTIAIPLTPLAFAAIALIVIRIGINAMCPED